MDNLQPLYDRRGEVLHQMKDIYAQAEKRGEGLNSDEEAKWQKADDEFKALSARIERGEQLKKDSEVHEMFMSTSTASAEEVRSAFSEGRESSTSNDKPKVTYRSAFNKWATHGSASLNQEERNIISTGRQAGAEFRGTDTQISSTPGLGGYLSPEEWSNQVVESMKAYGGMLQAGYVFKTKSGDTHHIPTEDTTSQMGAIIGQGVADTVADVTWNEKTMGSFVYTSKIIKIAEELYAEDDAYGVLGRVSDIAAKRVGRKLNLDLTVGAGTTLPFGVVTQATDSGISAGSATAVTRTELLDLIHSVDPAYRVGPKVGFMFNDSTLAAIRKLSIGSADDRPLWEPSMVAGAPSRIEGHAYYINQDMPSMTTGQKSILFGDFSKYWIRQVRGMTLSRSDQRYWEERVVAYFLTARFDGLLTDTAAIKYFENA